MMKNAVFKLGRYSIIKVLGSDNFYRAWYDQESGEIRRRSLSTSDLEMAKLMLAKVVASEVRGVRPPKTRAKPGKRVTIYVAGFGAYVKIGFTSGSVEQRLRGIQTGCPERIICYASILGPASLERQLHTLFADYRLDGEWFRNKGFVAVWIRSGCPLPYRGVGVGIDHIGGRQAA